LSEQDRQVCEQVWRSVCQRFASDPKLAIVYADLLISDVMGSRLPGGAASARLIETQFEAAHAIAEHNRRGEAAAEELKRAMALYAALFDELVGHASAAA
jgi:hypothetical protein